MARRLRKGETHYIVRQTNTLEWTVIEYSREYETVRGRYKTLESARAHIEQLRRGMNPLIGSDHET